ncbi:hypothetical protein [Blautia luti]
MVKHPGRHTDVLQNNEIQANKLTGFVMFLGSIILALVLIIELLIVLTE